MATGTEQAGLPAVHEAWLPRQHALHRPRHGGRQLTALLSAAIFFATPLVALGLGIRPAEFENRPLAGFPGLSQGWDFFAGLSPWATDHLVFRDGAISAADAVSRGVFGEPPPFGERKQTAGPIQTERPRVETNLYVPTIIEGKAGWMYLGDEVLSHCKPNAPLEGSFAQLRRLREGVEASGRRFAFVVAPDKATVVPDYLPGGYPGNDCHRRAIDDLWRMVGDEPSAIDLRDELRAWGNRLGRPVYPPLDAHWTDEGGVLMARRVAEKLYPGVTGTWSVVPAGPWEAPADLPPLIGRTGTVAGQRYAIKPDGVHDQTRDGPTDFNTQPLRLNSTSGKGTFAEKVGMYSDSFTIRALRYLAASFSDISVLHYGQVQKDGGKAAGEYLASNSVVVIEVAERILAAGNCAILDPRVVDGILEVLSRHPVR
ncbi:MAG TPA: hypothetical protein DGT23_10440 [Micromonosporaceae bacterium]|nr:hypothetical protein [Micromonosporaceae bacterium]